LVGKEFQLCCCMALSACAYQCVSN
jgi:hypothetical protein